MWGRFGEKYTLFFRSAFSDTTFIGCLHIPPPCRRDQGRLAASAILGRLASQSPANEFYRACRELGRLFKTEFLLEYLWSRELRQRIRLGLNKGEQLHALARQVFYGKQGTVDSSAFREEASGCGCLTLILACVIWWQTHQIDRALREGDPLGQGVEPSLLEHLSPIEWDNILLYGEYDLDPSLVRELPA
jgi:hypothetical protein